MDGSIRYPDAFVVRAPVANLAKVVTDPVVVFEIPSESTAGVDKFDNNAESRATPSIQRYVILQKTHRGAIVFSRKGEDWTAEIVGEGGMLRLSEVGIEFPLAEAYLGLDLPSAADGGEPG